MFLSSLFQGPGRTKARETPAVLGHFIKEICVHAGSTRLMKGLAGTALFFSQMELGDGRRPEGHMYTSYKTAKA